jgi:hypothetical protein
MSGSLPVTNLQDASRAKVARSTSTADQDIKGTWSESRLLSALALTQHNMTSASTWRLRLFANANWTSLVYDSAAIGAVPAKALGDLEWGVDPLGASVFTGWGRAFSALWFAPVAAKSFILTLSDVDNPAGYVEAARLFIGRHIEPEFNCDYGLALGWRDTTAQIRTDGGTLRSDAGVQYRALEFDLSWLTGSERARWMDIGRQVGRRRDVFVSCYPGAAGAKERDYAMAAKLTQDVLCKHDVPTNWKISLRLEEA